LIKTTPSSRDNNVEDILDSGFCIFHDNNYLQHYLFSFREERKRNIIKKLMMRVKESKENKKPLLCIGYHLPDVTIKETLTLPVYFTKCEFEGVADFSESSFEAQADFTSAEFSREATLVQQNSLEKHISIMLNSQK
jgi:hypothetical protein